MARPKSSDRRGAIVSAAIARIAADGLGAPTAAIAREAGVSNGSLFTYFETKADLLNRLYVELKVEMAAAALDGIPSGGDVRERAFYMWSRWMRWAASRPDKRRALAYLEVSGEITPESRQAAHETMAGIAELLERIRENGPMRDAPLGLVVALTGALADATIDFMIRDPANADDHCVAAFDAFWRTLT